MQNEKTILIHRLESEFVGIGEVNGFTFKRIFENDNVYIYEVSCPEIWDPHYEIFERKSVSLCIDFEKRLYSETEFKEIYPKSNDFGVWAFTKESYQDAIDKANELTYKILKRNEHENTN